MSTPKREAELKHLFGAELARQAPGFLVLAYATNGAPDRSIVGQGTQSNWECKHGTPAFRSPGDQELMCMRLAAAGHCRYIVWKETKSVQQTMIVHPREIHGRRGWNYTPEAWCVGVDMKWLVNEVLKEHR